MNAKLLSGLLVIATSCTGLLTNVTKAEAFTWDNNWSQPSIYGKDKTLFNDQPFQPLVQKERIELKGGNQQKVDPNNIFLKYSYNTWAYFINEGAGFKNQLAYQATGGSNQSGLLFDNISSSQSILRETDGTLSLGDGVNIGQLAAKTQLDFGLRANGWNIQQNAAATQSKADELKPRVEQLQQQAIARRNTAQEQQQTVQKLQLEVSVLQKNLSAKQTAVQKATSANKSAAETALKQAKADYDSALSKLNQAAAIAKDANINAAKAEKEAQALLNQMQKLESNTAAILGAANIYSTQTEENPDGLQHVVSYVSGDYLLLGFEDLYGSLGATGIDTATGKKNESSDRDFNDAVFAIKIGKNNARYLAKINKPQAVPEASALVPLLALGIAGLIRHRLQPQ